VRYNAILSIKDTTSGSVTYPVTKQEVKDYLRLEGFVDVDDSTSESLSDFDFDDTLIDETIIAVCEMFEQKCGFHVRPKTLAVVLTNLKGRIELPGPVGSAAITAVNEDGDAIDADLIEVVGNTWKFLKSPCYQDMVVSYSAGYGQTGCPSLPKAIKHDIIRAAAFYYMNRGDKQSHQFISTLAKKYSRNGPIC
jgi:hypothetical protein